MANRFWSFALLGAAIAVAAGAAPAANVHVKIIAINDFHGQVLPRRAQGRPVGGAAVLAAYVRAAQDAMRGRPAATPEDDDLDATGTIIAFPGDFAGASPIESAVFDDAPADAFLDRLADRHCVPGGADARCNVVGTLGNHEFENGLPALRRRLFGPAASPAPAGPARALIARFAPPAPAPRVPFVSCNVLDAADGKPLLPPSRIVEVRGTKIGFVGAVLRETQRFLIPSRAEQIRISDPIPAINAAARDLRARGARAVVVLLHDGGSQTVPPEAARSKPAGQPVGAIVDEVYRLDDAVDIVLSAHSHNYTNALVANRGGKQILVTQAFAFGAAYADVDLEIDESGVVAKNAAIVAAWGDAGPGRRPDRAVAETADDAAHRAEELQREVVGRAADDVSAAKGAAGLTPIGAVVAEAARAAAGADVGFAAGATIAGGIDKGKVAFREILLAAPYELRLYKAEMTGERILAALEEQWADKGTPLDAAGLTYVADRRRPEGARVAQVKVGGAPLDAARVYSVALNEYLARDPVRFKTFFAAAAKPIDATDLDALLTAARAGVRPLPPAAAIPD